MLLLEHDAKVIAEKKGIPVPAGVFVTAASVESLIAPGPGPWVVKAQVGVGGRGKAGGVGFANTVDEIASFIDAHRDAKIKGHRIAGFRIEEKVAFVREAFLSFMVDAACRSVRVLLSAQGGVDIEEHARQEDAMLSAIAPPETGALIAAGETLVAKLPADIQPAISAAIAAFAPLFIEFDAKLLEVNPLFVRADGSWIAGDMKLDVDENAFHRQPALEAAVRARPDAYPEANFKLQHDFDYVRLDPDGQIGLLTTGAGLSMMLIDEILQAGQYPYNFCDVRSGLLRGNPRRLIDVLKALAEGPEISVVFVNIFAGITDLGEFADLLLQALDAVPQIKVPVVARLIGNNFEAARTRLSQGSRSITLEMDLDTALQRVLEFSKVAA
jgi:succinyl-CoA synthetase beta subunit